MKRLENEYLSVERSDHGGILSARNKRAGERYRMGTDAFAVQTGRERSATRACGP